jgi:hypothetical protein
MKMNNPAWKSEKIRDIHVLFTSLLCRSINHLEFICLSLNPSNKINEYVNILLGMKDKERGVAIK